MPEISDSRPITPAQIRAIHVALAHHGIPDAAYRERLRTGYGVESCKQLTRRQAHELLLRLGVPLKRPPGAPAPRARKARSPRARPAPGVVRLPSGLQRRLIDALAGEIAWRARDGYAAWLKANMGLDRIATAEQAARVIEGLKAIKRRGAAK